VVRAAAGGALLIDYILLFFVPMALSLLLGYPVRRFALWLDVVDRPAKRKMHQIPIPLMGGLAIFIPFCLTSFAAVVLNQELRSVTPGAYFGLISGACIIVLVGVYDDIRGLTPRQKFAGQTLAALFVVSTGTGMNFLTNPLGESFQVGWLGIPLAVLWIVGVINAVNLIDGLDGLAVGIGGIAAIGLFAVAAPINAFPAALSLILAGSLVGFLRHNFYPARIFLGDSGSMFIGFTLAVIGLMGSFKATTATVLFLPIIVLGVPLFDTLFAIVRRARRKENPFKADREHIHHRLVRVGLHHRNVVLVLYFACAYLALTAYAIAQFPYQTAFLFLVLLTMGGVIGLRTLRFIEERLESSLALNAPGDGARSRASRSLPDGVRAGVYSSLVCEVSGFRKDFGHQAEIAQVSEDLRTMLSRRLRVDAVVLEPLDPGRLLLIVRTEPLKPAMVALSKDGIAWYLEEHQGRYGQDGRFPALHWVEPGPSSGAAGSASAHAVPAPRGSGDGVPLPLNKEPAGLAG
jgi:UDP-GlcNAc:undecaprenyl-phosphate GlcNAc-1-phosphate transferase